MQDPKAVELNTEMKVSKKIKDVRGGLKISNRFCWVFECRGYERGHAWNEQE
jgi:hypothetical protein